jgi:hypothetical protein
VSSINDHCKNGCGSPADVNLKGCCREECMDQLVSRTPPVPVTEDLLARLRASVEGLKVDLEAPLSPDEDDINH